MQAVRSLIPSRKSVAGGDMRGWAIPQWVQNAALGVTLVPQLVQNGKLSKLLLSFFYLKLRKSISLSSALLCRARFDTISRMRAFVAILCAAMLPALLPAAQKPLQIFFIDVEGGQSTLFVAPAGQSLLVDTGWGYNAFRDANRIVAAAKLAHIKKIDYVVITHYHADHVGGVPQLVQKMPVGTFIDHGPDRETSKQSQTLYSEYQAAIAGSNHILAKPGEQIPIKGMDVVIVSADGNVIERPLPGAGGPNGNCAGIQQKATDPSENARSVGLVITYGKLRIVDLGDLTWQKELELVCPDNKLGRADIFVVSHHGLAQ